MKAHSCNSGFAVEALDRRVMMSTEAYADFNGDGLQDKAAITNPTTITVSLAKPDGTYTVSAILTMPRNRTAVMISVSDFNADGKADINAISGINNGWNVHRWPGNGNGTFGSMTTETFRFKTGNGGTW